jgi:uroporphyrinogen decarboxylase
MTSRERVRRTLDFAYPDRAPWDLWTLPAVGMFQAEELRRFLERFPPDFGGARVRYGPNPRAHGQPYRKGTWTDEWGCVWEAAEDGVQGEIRQPILADWADLKRFEPPWSLIEEADFSETNRSCAESDLFIRAGCCPRPFERMQFLRGSQNLFLDLAYGVPEVYRLRDMVHDYFMRELELWVQTDVDAISFMDDWGSQQALLIDPQMWREVFKPLYRDYCDLAHQHGKYVFMHSDGHIEAIYPDLIEIGVDALNSQLFCMDIEGLAARYKGQITFWGEIDRQHILPFGTPEDCREAVRRVRRALDDGRGGLIAQCEWGKHNPPENIFAVFEAWEEDWDA